MSNLKMEEIKCTEHKQLCYLKTGTKAGPNYGVSFYVCPLSCGFFKQTQISSTKCPQHPDEIVDLQAIFFGKSSGEKRRYHRCHGRIAGQSWCGHNSEKKSSVKPLGDHNHQNLEKQSTSDSMPPAHQKLTKTPPKQDNSKESPSDSSKSEINKARSQSDSKAKSHDTEADDDDIVDGIVNLSIMDDSDEADQHSFEKQKKSAEKYKSNKSTEEEGMNQAMANLSTYDEEEFEDNPSDKSYDLKSNSSGSLPSPGFTDKDGKKSPRTDIAEKYSKYKIKKKSSLSPCQQDKESSSANYHENIAKHQSPNSDVNLPLSERIRIKSNESIKSSLSSCSSTSEDVNSPGGKSEVIDLISDSDEDESEKEAGLPEQPKRYQPPSQQQTASQQNQKSGSESIIKDAVKQAQDQRSQMKPSLAQQVTQNIVQGQKTHTQFIAPKSSALTSADMYNLQLDIDRRTDLQRQLERLKHVVATAKMSALPDKGEKLMRQVEDVERALKAVSRKIDNTMQTMRSNKTGQDTGSNNNPAATQGAVSTNNTQQPSDSSQYQTYKIVQPDGKTSVVKIPMTSGSTQPISNHQAHNPQGLKQTSILAHTQTIPPHIMQQLYAANPQAMQLYGGRMTNQRMREVTSITAEAIEKLHKQIKTCPDDTYELEDPEGLKVPLMMHQRQAIAWLVWREKQQPAGGILADDMGLGKTLTMISLIMKQKQLKENGTEEDKQTWLSRDKQLEKLSKKLVKSRATLVICPASLIHQWKTEIERRVKGSRLKVMLYHGPDRESDILRLADNDVVLTTYNLVAKEVGAADINAEDPAKDEDPDEEDKKDELSAVKHKSDSKMLRIAWDRIVLDEAHNIKNHKSLTAVAVCRLRAGFRWALTGTPIQNKLLDIFSLLRFLRCSPFDEYKLWKKQVERDNSGHSRLNVLVKCLLLRRTKNQVDKAGKPLVALPTKTVKEYEIKLSDNERKVYEKIFAQSKDVMRDYLKRHGEKDIDTSSQSSTSNVNPFQDKSPSKVVGQASQMAGGGLALNTQQRPGGQMILVMLLRLRQCCCHLSLMKDALEDEIAEDEGLELDIVEQMRGMGLEEEGTKEPSLTKSNACFEKDSLSTKVEAVIKKLREIRDSSEKSRRQKSVIVSQWTKMLDIIAVHLDRMGVKYSVIQGNIPPKKRNEFVEDFNTNPKGSEVMLVSLRAGGVGLNLIGGNHLFLLDQHWNPALEDQACDRIYRVGQTRDVMIHRFLCKDTVEEKIVQLQDSKKKLADNVLTGSKATSSKLTLQDLRMIFGV